MKVHSILEGGFTGVVIDIECTISNGLPSVQIVGFANKAVDEAKERIRGAFANSQINLPKKRIIINLAPADLPKETTSFDLAIATAIMATSRIIPIPPVKSLIIGELGLEGDVRPVRGIIGKVLAGKKLGYSTFFVPAANAIQAALVEDVTIYPVSDLKDLYLHFTGTKLLSSCSPALIGSKSRELNPAVNFGEIIGQQQAKRAMEISAAGGHNILLAGPPGTGKSMLAKALAGILPSLSNQEMLEVTHLHSLYNKDYEKLQTVRPFRSPHHSASDTSIVGGGKNPRPGEISLSHHGVLFLDEFPEFSRSTIEALRQPLEDGTITVARAKDTVEFPANFILVATANPCPCGNYGTQKACSCLLNQIIRYQRKLSGPIIDRIDLHVNVENVQHNQLLADQNSTSSQDIRQKVTKARDKQLERFGDPQKTNSIMSNRDIKQLGKLSPEARLILDRAAEKLDISARAYMRTIKVARTIADLEGSDHITPTHIAEALQYRPQQHFQA